VGLSERKEVFPEVCISDNFLGLFAMIFLDKVQQAANYMCSGCDLNIKETGSS
jgi:hypothetical protein